MKQVYALIGLMFVCLLAACSGDEAGPQVFAATLAPETGVQVITQPTRQPSLTATLTATATLPPPTQTPTATVTHTPLPSATPAPERVPRFALRRPIRVTDSTTQRDYLERTYPYGDTQDNTREVHSGVEFANPQGTTVVAAAAGQVIYAGDDSERLVGPRLNYYGKIVIVAHDDIRSPTGEPVYTLYAHLDRILVVETGIVSAGMPVGEVGATGIAIGPHLHFEVRVGDAPFDFNATRNPDLWLYPYPNNGLLAGRVVDAAGDPLPGATVEVRSMRTQSLLFAFTYGGDPANSDIAWGENFTRGDLPAGEYVVSVGIDGVLKFQQRVNVQDQTITWLDIRID